MDELQKLRQEIDAVDSEILSLIAKRLGIVKKIGEYKKRNKIPVIDTSREHLLLESLRKKSKEYGLDFRLMESIWKLLFQASYKKEK